MADLNDILTAQKNGVIAINNLNQTETNAWINTSVSPAVPYLKTISDNVAIIAAGETTAITSATATIDTLVVSGSGTLFNFSIVLPGSVSGFIHNASSIGSASTANALAMTPTVGGVFEVVQIKFTNGLVIKPGTGQAINVTYSLDA